MTKQDSAAQFHRDPLRFLDQAFSAGSDAGWLPGRQLCIAEPAAAKAVLLNESGLYRDHSDFFHTRRGVFGPRAAQVRIGRSARALLTGYLRERAAELPAAVAALAPASEWPDAGNRLVFRHLEAALIAPDSPARLRRTVRDVVEHAVLAGARDRSSGWTRWRLRRRVGRELTLAVEQRRARRPGKPADLLDVIVAAADPAAPGAELAEVFLSFVFAIAGSVGFTLAWSIYLLGTNPPTDAEPGWVVREALRLWPVAWMLARRPARAHAVAGIEVSPKDQVVVCPYLVHRHPRHWQEPARFRPERWASGYDQPGYIPFGWGPHTCAAASLSMQLVEDLLRILGGSYRLTIAPHATRPCIGPALAPPRFTAALAAHRPSCQEKGGE
jgi:cytochrome P450